MQILDRIRTNPNICGVEISFDGVSNSSIIAGWQPFYNQTITGSFAKASAGLSTFDFAEESNLTPSGYLYKQKATFRFLSSDKNRAERIALFHKLKFLKINLTNGLAIILGNNDFFQNTAPIIKTKSNAKFCEVEIACQAIVSAGYTPSYDIFGLPTFVPINLVN